MLLRERLPDVDAFHMLDESLLQDLLRHGPSPAIARRAVTFATLAADADADLIEALVRHCARVAG